VKCSGSTVRSAIGLKAPKARNETWRVGLAGVGPQLHYAPSALPVSLLRVPGALPQAVTFRAFGALELHEAPNKALFSQTEFSFWFGRFDAIVGSLVNK
jgi:hypothetical protein